MSEFIETITNNSITQKSIELTVHKSSIETHKTQTQKNKTHNFKRKKTGRSNRSNG